MQIETAAMYEDVMERLVKLEANLERIQANLEKIETRLDYFVRDSQSKDRRERDDNKGWDSQVRTSVEDPV